MCLGDEGSLASPGLKKSLRYQDFDGIPDGVPRRTEHLLQLDFRGELSLPWKLARLNLPPQLVGYLLVPRLLLSHSALPAPRATYTRSWYDYKGWYGWYGQPD